MADDPRIGATLAGKYTIARLIGRGAFGAVFEAMNIELEKRVAVKLIEPQYVQHEEVVTRFRAESRAASRVESEHIIQVFDVGNDDKHGLYQVMELLHGEDLADRLDRELKLSPAVAVHIAVQAARGLAKAHAAGVVHRDLKPANIFLVTREDGSLMVKIVDFGISKLIGRQESGGVTRAGTSVGTPNYMSPEQARGLDVDGRTDVWALGAVLYEMLSGVPAYSHEATYEETIIAIATGPEPRLGEIAPWVPKEVVAVVDKALTRDLVERIQDCGELARMLGEAMPNATRPRREESLYMEPSDYSEPAARLPVTGHEPTVEVETTSARSRAPTTISASRVSRATDKPSRWPWVIVPLVLIAIGFAAWRAVDRQEPVAGPPPPPPSTSVSESAQKVVTSVPPKPHVNVKPKSVVSAKPSTKPSASTKPK